MKINKDFENLLLPLSKIQKDDLTADIRKNGCLSPLIIWDEEDVLLDGHNRLAICTENKIKYQVSRISLPSSESAYNWIITNQLNRRNVTPEQAAYLRGKMYNLVKKDRNENLTPGADKKRSKVHNAPSTTTAEKIAEEQKVSQDTIKRDGKYAESVDKLEKEIPGVRNDILSRELNITKKDVVYLAESDQAGDLIDRVKTGQSKTIKAAKKHVEIEHAKEQNLKESKDSIKVTPKIYLKSESTFLEQITDIDLLLTDPPYMTDVDINTFVEWLNPYLKKIKTTGRAYVFIGAYPEELRAYLALKEVPNMPLEQVLVWTYRNTLGNNPQKRYKNNWQAILYYQGVDAPDLTCPETAEQWGVQNINAPDGRQGDRFHEWQKPIEIAERFIRHSTKQGDTVIDPFACTGTFLIAAGGLGRNGIGCDIEMKHLEIARDRGCTIIGKKI